MAEASAETAPSGASGASLLPRSVPAAPFAKEDADVEALGRRPIFWEFFSGDNLILSKAFEASGWIVLPPIDWALCSPRGRAFDESQGCSFQTVSDAVRGPDFVWFGIGSHNFSESSNADVVSERVVDAAEALLARDRGFCEEDSALSRLWQLPEQRRLAERPEVVDTCYFCCSWQGGRAKAQRLRHCVEELRAVHAECHHVHDADQWSNPKAWQQEATYTARLAVAVASSVARWAIRIMRLCWDSPVLPQPVCHGRVRVHGDPSSVRLRALPAALAEVSLAAPGSSGHGARLASVKNLRSVPDGSV